MAEPPEPLHYADPAAVQPAPDSWPFLSGVAILAGTLLMPACFDRLAGARYLGEFVADSSPLLTIACAAVGALGARRREPIVAWVAAVVWNVSIFSLSLLIVSTP